MLDIKYIRENIASKVLAGIPLNNNIVIKDLQKTNEYKLFTISDLLVSLEKGKTKSINRKIENKYISGFPLIVAKKDNNGIGGLTDEVNRLYKDKFCIISGGDGGGQNILL